jgi:hypothetical protein
MCLVERCKKIFDLLILELQVIIVQQNSLQISMNHFIYLSNIFITVILKTNSKELQHISNPAVRKGLFYYVVATCPPSAIYRG